MEKKDTKVVLYLKKHSFSKLYETVPLFVCYCSVNLTVSFAWDSSMRKTYEGEFMMHLMF